MAAGADVLDAHARQAKDDLGLGRAAQEPIGVRIPRRRMAAHREAPGRGREGLGLVVDRTRASATTTRDGQRARAPGPSARPRRGRSRRQTRRVSTSRGAASAEPVDQRDLAAPPPDRRRNRPRYCPAPRAPDRRRTWTRPGLKAWPGDQGRDRGAAPAGVEAPAVIAALDLAPVEIAGAERHAAMRADVAQRERRAGGVAADQHRLAQHHLRHHRAAASPGGRGPRNTTPPAMARRCPPPISPRKYLLPPCRQRRESRVSGSGRQG